VAIATSFDEVWIRSLVVCNSIPSHLIRSLRKPRPPLRGERHRGASIAPRAPPASTSTVAARMSAQRQRDTAVEMRLRSALHKLGLRFRLQRSVATARRRADIVFVSTRVVVFVDGCFWHVCPRHASWPRANAAWWRRKLIANQRRDRSTDHILRSAGWTVMRVWEHEDPGKAASRIHRIVGRRISSRG